VQVSVQKYFVVPSLLKFISRCVSQSERVVVGCGAKVGTSRLACGHGPRSRPSFAQSGVQCDAVLLSNLGLCMIKLYGCAL